jgi:isoaspartyl peptidase/L-asparaginase-like protein (Ntn-hydrolase superfamily)
MYRVMNERNDVMFSVCLDRFREESRRNKTKHFSDKTEVKIPFHTGTVGCVALDMNGTLGTFLYSKDKILQKRMKITEKGNGVAAGTSTGGVNNKMAGRVGDR